MLQEFVFWSHCLMFICCRYYHNITSNTLGVLEAMARHKVKKLIYSSTCATYGEPEKMPITEDTPQVNKVYFRVRSLIRCESDFFLMENIGSRFRLILTEKLKRWQRI